MIEQQVRLASYEDEINEITEQMNEDGWKLERVSSNTMIEYFYDSKQINHTWIQYHLIFVKDVKEVS